MRKFLSLVVLLVLLASCGNLKNISVEKIDSVRLKDRKGTSVVLEMDVTVNNPSGHKLFIKAADLDILLNGYTFAVADLHERVLIPKKMSSTQTVAMNISIKDPLALLMGGSKLFSKNPDLTGFTLSGKVKAGHKLFSKKYKFDNINLSNLDVNK